MSGVRPANVFAFTLAPFSTKALTALSWLLAAARWSGVLLSFVSLSMSHPAAEPGRMQLKANLYSNTSSTVPNRQRRQNDDIESFRILDPPAIGLSQSLGSF
eukprot:Filipodium_phascolosomae@DN349_c0_g1_i2.p1